MDETKAHKAPKEGAVPPKKQDKRITGKLCEHMTYAARETFKRLRTNIMIAFADNNKQCKVIGITSAQPAEGKSTVSVNLAYSLAELGKYVLLIDGDLRRPSLHEKLNMRGTSGLAELLNGNDNLQSAVVHYQSDQGDVGFDVLTGGSIPDNPAELLNSKRFERIISALSSVCDYIILDLPPINAVIDAAVVSKHTDGILLVARENHCPKYLFAECVEQLRYAKANILGFVLNGSVEGSGKRYQYSNQPYNYGK